MKILVYIQTAFLFMAAAAAGPDARSNGLPFHGTVETVETVQAVIFPIVFNSSVGEGNATRLGKFQWKLDVQINVSVPGAFTATGTGLLTAANGDQLFTNFTATSADTVIPNVIEITEVHKITGGTGRFASAAGMFTRSALSDLALGFSFGTFEGYLSY